MHRRVSRYQLEQRLGEGAFGETWQAVDPRDGSSVVIKLAASGYRSALPWGVPREIEVMQRGLAHANIPSFLDHGRTVTRRPWIAIEYVPADAVRDLIIANRLSADQAIRVAVRIGLAAAAAHALGVIHCDISPHNVLVPQGLGVDRARLIDFGIAELLDATGQTSGQVTSGTPRYAAPEQRQALPMSPETDTWGLAVLLYFMLYRKPPFALEDKVRDHLEFPTVAALNTPRGRIQPVLRAALAPDRGTRPTALAFVEALEAELAP